MVFDLKNFGFLKTEKVISTTVSVVVFEKMKVKRKNFALENTLFLCFM